MKKSFVLLSAVFVLGLGLFVSCGKKTEGSSMNEQQMKAMNPSKMVMINQSLTSQEAKVGEYVVSIVSGGMFMVTEKSLFSIYQGKKFYLLNELNKQLFDADPKKYLSPKTEDTLNTNMEM